MAETKVIVRKKKDSSRPWKPLVRKICLTGFIGLVSWFVFLQLWSVIFPLLLQYEEVDVGTLCQNLDIETALVIRDETVVFASRAGTLRPVAQEGQRVAESDLVAVVENSVAGRQAVEAPRAGVVCYHTDGWERVLTPQSMATLDLASLDKRSTKLVEVGAGAPVESGQALFKIVNNLQPTLIWLQFDSQYADLFPPVGKKLSFSLGNEVLQGTLKSLTTQGVISQGILELDRKELLHERQVQLSIVLDRAEGIIIPNRALVVREDEPGVYKKVMKGYKWVPVKILLEDADCSVVEGLSRGDRIITNPYLLDES